MRFKRLLGRLKRQPSGGGGSTLSAVDFTYLGAYRMPTPSLGTLAGEQAAYGFTLRRESSDATQPVHLIASAYRPRAVWTGTQRAKLSMRGTTISVYIDEGSGYPSSPAISVTDSAISAKGKAGIYADGGSGYTVDNFAVTNAAGGSVTTDNFTGTDGTTLAGRTLSGGGTWSQHASFTGSAFETISNAVVRSAGGSGGAYYYASGTPTNADYDVEADFAYLGGAYTVGLVGRVDTAAQTMYLLYYNADADTKSWVLAKWVSGSLANLAIAPSPIGATGKMAWTYEWRDITPEIPASPTLSASYSQATTIKSWGNIFGPHPSKLVSHVGDGGTYIDLGDGQAGTNRAGNIAWDPVDERLYWVFSENYGNFTDVDYLGYAELNYSTGAVTPHGMWRTTATEWKGGTSGIMSLPSGFVSTAGLGTKRMATFGSNAPSTAASGDGSAGPIATAFVPPSGGATEGTALTSTRMIGYSPTAPSPATGRDRADRPAWAPWYYGEGSNAANAPGGGVPFTWPYTKWHENDRVSGGVFIEGTSKSGFVMSTSFYKGMVTYVAASNTAEMLVHGWTIISEADLASVVTGVKAPYEIQPAEIALIDFPVMIAADYVSVKCCDVSTIASNAGDHRSGERHNQPTGPGDPNAVVTTSTAHGLGSVGTVGTIGVKSSSNIEYNDFWIYRVLSTTTLEIWNASLDSYTFSGTTGTGGELWFGGYGSYPNNGLWIIGLAYDDVTQKLYMGFVHKDNTPMVAVWSVNC